MDLDILYSNLSVILSATVFETVLSWLTEALCETPLLVFQERLSSMFASVNNSFSLVSDSLDDSPIDTAVVSLLVSSLPHFPLTSSPNSINLAIK